MKGLKNLLIFCAGGLAYAFLMAKGMDRDTEYPREGAVEYEDDRIKVTRCGSKPPKNISLATIVYKNKPEEE